MVKNGNTVLPHHILMVHDIISTCADGTADKEEEKCTNGVMDVVYHITDNTFKSYR